jgi:molecular chaperone DnaK
MANIIGIDLGTSTTLLAHLSNSGEAIIYKNKDNELVTHSAVWFEGERSVIVGTEAKKMFGVAKDDEIFIEFKRDMGDASVVHNVHGKEWHPRDFSALVLRQIREHFEANNGKIDAVIITIPANFSDEARVNTINAAKEAGFNLGNDALVNEPTAAAIYYASTSPSKLKGKYLIYDFGGGTFDATILDVDGDDIKVLTSMGVQRLGGKDLDEKLIGLIGQKYTQLLGREFKGKETMSEIQLTRWEVEQAKLTLSSRERVSIAMKTQDRGIVRAEITRNEFNEAISTLITQAELAVDTALDNAKLEAKDLAGVFLAGGSTLVPAVAQSVERHLGIKPISRDPVGSVALGACMYSAIRNKTKLSGAQTVAVGAKQVQDVTPHFFGTTYRDRASRKLMVETIIAKDRPLPCTETKSFSRGVQQGDSITIRITQSGSEQTDPDFVDIIWDGELKGLPLVQDDSEIKITYTYDTNGVMQCTILDVLSGKKLSATPLEKAGAAGAKKPAGGGVNIKDYTLE